jgi:serine/threonine protein kinase
MAPEVIMQREITPKVDVYAFGIILWEILTRTEAFSHHNEINRFAQAICRHRERPAIPPDTPESLRTLMTACWDHEPQARPNFSEIVPRLEVIIAECEQLEAIMRIEHRIRDLNGRILWKENFLALVCTTVLCCREQAAQATPLLMMIELLTVSTASVLLVKTVVPWEQFIRTLCFLIQFPLPDDISRPNERTRQIFALKELLGIAHTLVMVMVMVYNTITWLRHELTRVWSLTLFPLHLFYSCDSNHIDLFDRFIV